MCRPDLTGQGLAEINWNVKNILGAISKNLTTVNPPTGTALYDSPLSSSVLVDFKLAYLG